MMSIITISRGAYTVGAGVAEKVAQNLGYDCISREVLLEASDEFNISEIKLIRAIRDAPKFLERYTFGRMKYINHIRADLLKRLSKDNIVYHGFAGHFFVKDIPHVLKVRIIASMKYRIENLMKREKVSVENAGSMVAKIDKERQKWSKRLYGIDTWDSRLYDLVINIEKISVDHAVEMICHTVKLSPFQTTAESQKQMDELVRDATEKLKGGTDLSPFFEPMRDTPWRQK
jgi:cytidylate kinase